MSLYGALYSGVSGLKAQGTNMGVISDNISNLNTIGYKSSEATFETLVTNSPGSVSYNPGGVLADSRQFVDKQGILQATDSPTDIAVSGNGFFAVNRLADGSGDVLYTRSGSFRQDAFGNFVNTSGFFLQGWPLDRDGRLPGEPGNLNTTAFSTLDSLETVNVENTNGIAAATTNVEIGANLDSRQTIYPGAGRTIAFNTNNAGTESDNVGISADDIILPVGMTETTWLAGAVAANGDQMRIDIGNGITYDFEYGGLVSGNYATGATGAAAVDFTNATGSGSATYDGNVISSPTDVFFDATNAPASTAAAATFTINTPTTGDVTFTYRQTSPNPLQPNGEFNNIQTLAAAIDDVVGLTARIQENAAGESRLVIAPEDANEALTFSNGSTADIDWVGGLGLQDTAAGTNRFITYQDLYNKINDQDGITAVLENPNAETVLTIRTDDPLGTITFQDDTTVGVPTNFDADPYNMVFEMGLIGAATPTAVDPNTFGPEYDPNDEDYNMTGGNITPQFSRNIRIFDSFGQGHNLTMSFIKSSVNTWAVEVYAADAEDIVGNSLTGGDNFIAAGTITFNGDGTLRSVSSSIVNPIDIQWTNGAIASEVQFDFGTAGVVNGTPNALEVGLSDGLGQFASDYNVAFVQQNGAEVGSLIGVTIDEEGFVYANYNNGESLALYRIPLADFANPNGLNSLTGNVWSETQGSGEVNLREARSSGVGEVVSGVLETSTSELAEELTDMIVSQRAYQANTKVISTTDELLEELNRL